ncbi:hypothetical protein BRC86_11605 [Halobacteriales archaeon QS_3_64_16]|jgi:hypothetical protein|nr:MAG: hypothetical protein BRC86_11605 [Halobacteriales archaeon QS_3_64_16]
MAAEITEDEEGKSVVSSDGEEVGIVIDVQYGTARVEPDPGLTDELKAKVGFGDTDEESYPLQEERIEAVTDDEIRLRDDR